MIRKYVSLDKLQIFLDKLYKVFSLKTHNHYDIGDIYVTTNPNMNTAAKVAARFGGTWKAFAQGRTLVGVDPSDTDFKSVGLELGEKTHTLTTGEMPSHSHSITTGSLHGSVSSGGTSRTRFYAGTSGGYAFQNKTQGNLVFVYGLGNAGSNTAHNNIQPSETVFYWKRIG